MTSQIDSNAVGTLRYCVGRTNANLNDSIQINVPGWYGLDSTITFTRSTTVNGSIGVLILPGDAFANVSLIKVGGACSPVCSSTASVVLNNLEIGAVGLPDIQGIHVQPASGLTAFNLRMSGFDNSLDGGAIRADWASSIVLHDSDLRENSAFRGAAIFSTASTLDIHDSTFEDNFASGTGGAIHVDPSMQIYPKVVTIDGSEFFSNYAAWAGAISVGAGTLNVTATITNSDFFDNSAEIGGALRGAATISDSNFESNTAKTGGALALHTTCTLSRNVFYLNSASDGGAVAFIGSTATDVLTVNDSAFEKNSFLAGDGPKGGGIFIFGGANTHTVANSTFYLNGGSASLPGAQTTGGGVALYGGAKADLIHTSFRSNIANTGGGVALNGSTAKVKSSVISQSTGGNCANTGGVLSQATSLSSDATCAFSFNNVNPLLGLPAANGGPTHTMKPQSGSPLLTKATCYRTTDQRGFGRPASKCDIGSVEI